MSKARITYRFDRETRGPAAEDTAVHPAVSQEEQPTGKVIPLYQEDFGLGSRDYGAWKSPFDAETDRIEKLIRGAEAEHRPLRVVRDAEQPKPIYRETGQHKPLYRDAEPSKPLYYTSEDADVLFERIPFYEEEPVSSMPSAPVTYRRARKRTNWFGMTSSIAGAILTGVVLGMFVLSIFRGDPAPVGNDAVGDSGLPAITEDQAGDMESGVSDGSTDLGTGENASGDQTAFSGVANVQLAEQTYYLVQNGVFSSQEGAELAADELKEKGLAGAVEAGEKLSVFAGAAIDRDDALLISHQLQSAGLEVYIKPYVLPAAEQLGWSADGTESLQDYLVQSRKLVDELITLSLQHLNEAAPSAISAEQLKAVKADHQAWTASANAVLAEAPEQLKLLLQSMNTSINTAVVTVEQYNKKPSSAYMWQVQSAATEHVIKQKQLLEKTSGL